MLLIHTLCQIIILKECIQVSCKEAKMKGKSLFSTLGVIKGDANPHLQSAISKLIIKQKATKAGLVLITVPLAKKNCQLKCNCA